MAVTHALATRNALADLVVDAVDAGVTVAPGKLVMWLDDGLTEVATLLFQEPAFANAGSGQAAITGDVVCASATGNAAPATKLTIRDSDDADILLGSVGTSGEDVNLSSNIIAATDTVTLTVLTYTAPI